MRIIDSHTGGEPTRVIVEGGPPLEGQSMAELVESFRSQFDRYRSAVVNEPRASEAAVGALLCKPQNADCLTGVIFFNNIGYLGMCGHGTIGLGATLAYLGKANAGLHKIETPVGVVQMELHSANEVTVQNVPSYRWRKDVAVEVDGFGAVTGDVAWGGNWFFLTHNSPCTIEHKNIEQLTDFTSRVRAALNKHGIAGAGGLEIDHIEISDDTAQNNWDSRNFVLCPGKSYDRSPCGTGTSAKMACLYADGQLKEGQRWRQASVIGSTFEGSIRAAGDKVIPSIRGCAYVNADTSLVLNSNDPFCWGIRS